MTETTPTREVLAVAIEARDAVAARTEAAHARAVGARHIVEGIEAELVTLKDIHERATAEHAATVAAALDAGEAPVFSHSAELHEAMVRKAQLEADLFAAKAAADQLAMVAEGAKRKFDDLAREVVRAADAVLLDEARAKVAEIEAAWKAIEAAHIELYGVQFSIQIPPDVAATVAKFARIDDPMVNTPRWRQMQASTPRWRDFRAALTGDAAATF